MQLTRERLDLALKSARMAVWDWDLTNNFLTWDESMYELYGVSEKSSQVHMMPGKRPFILKIASAVFRKFETHYSARKNSRHTSKSITPQKESAT